MSQGSRRGLRSRVRQRLPVVLGVGSVVALVCATMVTAVGANAADTDCRAKEFFVSPEGEDRAAPSSEHRPWQTIEHARDYIRDRGLNGSGMRCDIVVSIKAGDYLVDETIEFTEADSGHNSHSVIYRSADGPGEARFLGARPVTGWEAHDGQIYRAEVDADEPFHTLFEDGQRATTAREPNRRSEDEWAPYFKSGPAKPDRTATQEQIWFDEGEWSPDWDLDQAQVVIWSGGEWTWFTDTVPISDVDWEDRQVTLDYWTRYHTANDELGSRYFLQNSLDLLDEPGEFYLDQEEGTVYYWPRNGSLEDSTVWAPTVDTVINVAGSSPDERVRNLTFDGLAVQYSDFMEWYRYGWISNGDSGVERAYPEYDRQIELPRNRHGAITMENTANIDLRGMHISDTGYHAVYMLFANENNTVSDSLIDHTGADAIKVEGPHPGDGDIARDHVFTNNYIHHYGELVPGDAAGVELMNSGGNEISHSVFEHSARYAVSIETRPEVSNEDNYAEGNELTYLRIAHMGKDSGDTGALYAYGVHNDEPHLPPNSLISQVTIDDVNADPSMPDGPPHGVHMDFGGCGFEFSHIEVSNVQGNDYHNGKGCNEQENNSWHENFDPAQMEYDQIGTNDDFPYPVPE